MATVLISGGFGLIGKHLTSLLIERGYEVSVLSRKRIQIPDIKTYFWDPDNNFVEEGAIESADYIIHLAGTNIGEKRWTDMRKLDILNSRIKTGQLLYQKVKETNTPIKKYITASAIGYYGIATPESVFSESDPPGNDFVVQVCEQWEQIASDYETIGIPSVVIRTGIVLSKTGGALPKMVPLANFGLNIAFGSGKHYLPWIHINDVCNIYIKALENPEIHGVYNAVAPQQITYNDFNKKLHLVLGNKSWFPKLPSWLFEIVLGEMSTILLNGNKISSEKIQNAGYEFEFPVFERALSDLLKNKY